MEVKKKRQLQILATLIGLGGIILLLFPVENFIQHAKLSILCPEEKINDCRVRIKEHESDGKYSFKPPNVKFPTIINDTLFPSRELFDWKHCPYSAEFIVDSNPLTFKRFCIFHRSQLNWEGKCRQVYRMINFVNDSAPDMIAWGCIFQPSDERIFPKNTDTPIVNKLDP